MPLILTRSRNPMLLLRKPMLCWGSLKSLRKRRMAEQENSFLLLWEITVICVSNVVLRGIRLEPRTCLSPQSRQACLMWLSHLKADSTCESVGLPKACCELRIHVSWTEFVLLVEEKSKPFISCICLCQAPCLVLIMRRVKVKRDLSARFKRCLPTPSIDTKPTLVWLPKFVDAVVGNKSRTVDGDNANRGRSLTWHQLVKPSTVTPSTQVKQSMVFDLRSAQNEVGCPEQSVDPWWILDQQLTNTGLTLSWYVDWYVNSHIGQHQKIKFSPKSHS